MPINGGDEQPTVAQKPRAEEAYPQNKKKEDISGKVRQVKTFKDRFEELAKKGVSVVSKDTLENARMAIRHGKVAVATNRGLEKLEVYLEMDDRQQRAALAVEHLEKIRAQRLLVPDCLTIMIKSASRNCR